MSQGSVLGPILFFIYIDDLCDLSIDAKSVSFADDTILNFKSYRSISTVKRWLDNNVIVNKLNTLCLAFIFL